MVISPVTLTDDIRTALESIGHPKHIVSPNSIHHLYMGEWQGAYPDAKLYASQGLPDKRGDLRFAETLSEETPAAWAGQVDQVVMGPGGFLPEVVFHHRLSRTVVFTDFIMDFDPAILSPITRITTRINQMYRHTPRGVQLASNTVRGVSRRALEEVRAWEAEHLIVAHSPWLCVDGKDNVAELLFDAFDWLDDQRHEVFWQRVRGAMGLVIWPLHLGVSWLLDELPAKLHKRN
jgi:hypothetical protein